MAGLVLGTVGAIAGGIVGGPMGAKIGWMAGSAIGGMVDRKKQPDAPQIPDLKVMSSAYGRAMSTIWGTVRKAGDLIWSTDKQPHPQHQSAGKGGGDPVTGWTYSISCAILLCEGEISGLRRIWANGRLIYDISSGNTGHVGDIKYKMEVYKGTKTQLPDPTIESIKGVGKTPAYRNRAYVVFTDLDLSQFGGDSIPNFEFEIVRSPASQVTKKSQYIRYQHPQGESNNTQAAYGIVYNELDKFAYLVTAYNGAGGAGNGINVVVRKIDPNTNQIISTSPKYPFGTVSPDSSITMSVYTDNAGNIVIPGYRYPNNNYGFAVINPETWGYNYIQTLDTGTRRFGPRFFHDMQDLETWYSINTVNTSGVTGIGFYSGGLVNNSINGVQTADFDLEYVTDTPAITAFLATSIGKYALDPFSKVAYYPTYNADKSIAYIAKIRGTSIDENFFQIPDIKIGQNSIEIDDLYFDSITKQLFIQFSNPGISVRSIIYKLDCETLEYKRIFWGINGYGKVRSLFNIDKNNRRFISVLNQDNGYGAALSSLKWDTFTQNDISYSPEDNDGISAAALPFTAFSPENDAEYWHGVKNLNAVDKLISYQNAKITELNKVPEADRDTVAITACQTEITRLNEIKNTNDGFIFVNYGNRVTDGSYPLAEAIKEISANANISSNQIDVTNLAGLEIRGYQTTTRTSARTIIEQLAQIFRFDEVESNGKITFKKRGGGVVCSIPESDLGAQPFSQSLDFSEVININRAQESDLPKNANLIYLDYDKDKQQNNQGVTRIVERSQNSLTLEIPIVLKADEAKACIEALMFMAWANNKKFTFETTYKYCFLEPTDVIELVAPEVTHIVRITKKNEADGIIKFEAESEDSSVYTTRRSVGATTSTPSQTLVGYSNTNISLLDIPILSEMDNDYGVYFTVRRASPGMRWNGCEIFMSTSSTGEYQSIGQMNIEGNFGSSLNTLGNFDIESNDIDRFNSVIVKTSGTLGSISYDQLLNGENLCVLGDEVLQFQTATLAGENTYVLSNFLRARYATEQYLSSHTSGERFIMLPKNDKSVGRILKESLSVNQTLFIKAVTLGTKLSDAKAVKFINTAAGLKPYPVCNIRSNRNATGDINIVWYKRVRGVGLLRDNLEVFDLDGDTYEVDIMKDGVAVRTILSNTLSVNYTSAQQTVDFGSVQSSVNVNIYKTNQKIGRGFAKNITV